MVEESPERVLEVGREAAGERLDAFLATGLGISRAEARRLLARGRVALDGRTASASAKGLRLSEGARVELAAFAPEAAARPIAEARPGFPVLARGPGWLALDKPPGVPVHPLEPDETGTLLNFAVAEEPGLHGVGEGGLRSGVVHRLDSDTSGVVLLATDEPTWQRLRAAFAAHRVRKRYRAVVLGALPDRGRADVGLVVAQHRPARVRVVAPDDPRPGVRPGRLAWVVRERLRGACLLEVDLETGFLHQVRATLAHLGAPVAGDRRYGPAAEADPSGAGRQLLHAASVDVDEIRAESPDPPDFAAALDRLRVTRSDGSDRLR